MSSSPLNRRHAEGFMEASRSAQDAGLPTVCVDRRLIRLPHGTGAAVYAEGLRRNAAAAGYRLTHLVDASTGDAASRNRLLRWGAALYPWPVAAKPHPGGLLAPDAFRRAQIHFDVYGRYLHLRAAAPPGLMHWSYPLPLHMSGVPNLYTVHDLIPLLRPELTPIRPIRSRRMLGRLRREAAHIVTVSETSRREIIATLGWPPDRVTNTYEPVETPPWTPEQALAARNQAMSAAGVVEAGYFIHVGTIERRKNIARLIEAYRLSGSSRALVLAGPRGWHAADELAAAQDLLVPQGRPAPQAAGRPRVIQVGWMARDALLGLIQGAAGLLAPSLAEGFGLPAVEAMALGTPVVTSHSGAPAEIAGDAAMLVDPLDVRSIAGAVAALDTDAALRARLSGAGVARARLFSAEAYARRLSALYAAVLSAHAGPVPGTAR